MILVCMLYVVLGASFASSIIFRKRFTTKQYMLRMIVVTLLWPFFLWIKLVVKDTPWTKH